jgi:hypothetical protein
MGTGAGQLIEDADWDSIEQSSSERPIGRLVASSSQALADNTQVAVTWASEEIDTHNFHSTSVNTSRVTPTVPGVYEVRGTGFFEAQATPNPTGGSDVTIRKNGSTMIPPAWRFVPPATFAFSGMTTVLVEMNGSTDYFELMLRQDSAGADNTNSSVQYTSVLEWKKVRDL